MFKGFKNTSIGRGFFNGVPNNLFSVANNSIAPFPDFRQFGSVGTATAKWQGGVLAPNGKIYGIPFNSSAILEIDPLIDGVRQFGSVGTATAKWQGGVLAPNGKIYGIPFNSSAILEINDNTNLIIPEMVNIPNPISGLATSIYNQHQNKL